MKNALKFAAALAAIALTFVGVVDGGMALAALPLVVTLTCTDIAQVPGSDIEATSDYAYIGFEVNDSDNEILAAPDTKLPYKKLWFRVTEAQKDDFTVGSSYDIDITAT